MEGREKKRLSKMERISRASNCLLGFHFALSACPRAQNYTRKIDEFVMWSKQKYVLCVPFASETSKCVENKKKKVFCVYVFSAEGWGSSLKHKTQASSVRIVCFRYKSMRESGDMACRYVNDFQSRNGSSLSGAGKKKST